MKHAIQFILPVFLLGLTAHADERLFTLKVLPTLTEKCFGCHDPAQKVKGELDMSTREAFLKGGESIENVLVPKSAEKSFIITAVKWADPDYEMPPKANDRLSPEQIAHLEQWINAGAPWPSAERQAEIRAEERKQLVTDDGMIVKTSGGTSDSWTYRRYDPDAIWAFQSVTKPKVPEGASNPIDAFIGTKLKAAGFEPAPSAERRTLLRRATYDLTGLPPTPEQTKTFLEASEADPERAWSELIDRLLESPHYGERWAQHWLDVARYADTAGLSNDYERSNMWRYRDYVIRAFNEDMPYDRFVKQQLSGDEMSDYTLRKRLGDDEKYKKARQTGDQYNEMETRWLIASSFLRMGPWDNAMVKPAEAKQQYVDDVVNAVGQTFLSTTMRCFKCHDHKFDPLPTRDYYRMYAVFHTTQQAERPTTFLSSENRKGFEDSKAEAKELHTFAKTKFDALNKKVHKAERDWYAERDLDFVPEKDRKKAADEDKPPRHAGLTEIEKGRHKVRKQDEWIWNRRMERYQPMVQSIFNGPDPKYVNGRKLRMGGGARGGWNPNTFILAGGSLEAPGEKVTPGVLSGLGIPAEGAVEGDPFKVTDNLAGRRTELARWIAHKDNPLTTRSIVNRIWQYHFGQAIAGNPNNFGVKGAPPTHPELLDWLASDFVENGWTMKRLHKLIMTSATYRQASEHPQADKLAIKDADNKLFAHYPVRRLSAEELRDGILRVTGELNPEMGGIPIKPEINIEVALQPRMIQFSIAPTYLPSRTPDQRHRRSIYAYRVRGMANPFLETFNQPNPNDSCEARDAAAVSPQAFTLLNSDGMTDRSVAFALRLMEDEKGKGPAAHIKRGFELAFGRQPSAKELQAMQAYVKEMREYHQDVTPERRTYPTEITRSLVEEFSGAPFDYVEILPVYNDFVPDKQAADVGPYGRALADFCLLLFNSHEFMYVY